MRILTLSLLFVSGLSFADVRCMPNLTKFNVCDKAEQIVKEVRPMLPMKLSEGVIMYAIDSSVNKIIAKVRIAMTEAQVDDYAKKNNTSQGAVKDLMSDQVRIAVCAKGNPLRSFIRLGGEMQYNYLFPSGNEYTTVNVRSCT
ncbi:TPA: hypothetical protein MBF34_002550 [Klebsiella aerogenes]|nr:hypothetical protein [Klebsiella aerogenes]